jgi:hypothetical protein
MIPQKAIEELKRICLDHNRIVSDAEALAIGSRIIRFLRASKLLSELPSKRLPMLSEAERITFDFIKKGITEHRAPSIRKITSKLGFLSSRSGHRVVGQLMRKGIVSRTESGSLAIAPCYSHCQDAQDVTPTP